MLAPRDSERRSRNDRTHYHAMSEHSILPSSRSPGTAALAGQCWQHFTRTYDVDEHACSMPGWVFEYDQLSGGGFIGTVHHVQLPGLRLVHEYSSCAVRQRGEIGDGVYGLGLTVDSVGHASFNGHALGDNGLMNGTLDSVDICTAANFAHIAIVGDAAILDAAFESVHGCRRPATSQAQLVTELDPRAAARIRMAHLEAMRVVMTQPSVLDNPRAAERMRDDLLFRWIASLPFEFNVSSLGTAVSRKRLVDQACELVLSRLDISMIDLCAELNTSRRKLEYSFKETLGISPAKYLRAVRLNLARRDLKRETPEAASVYDVASRWGFWHNGEFSAGYRQLFGESPSETLRRAPGERRAS